jgi:hypothetical protein
VAFFFTCDHHLQEVCDQLQLHSPQNPDPKKIKSQYIFPVSLVVGSLHTRVLVFYSATTLLVVSRQESSFTVHLPEKWFAFTVRLCCCLYAEVNFTVQLICYLYAETAIKCNYLHGW